MNDCHIYRINDLLIINVKCFPNIRMQQSNRVVKKNVVSISCYVDYVV